MRPDKAKVVDEVWDDERIDAFLSKPPMGNENPEFSQLLHAYRSMRVEDFSVFLQRFQAAGGNVSARANDGRTLAESIAHHAKAQPFLDLLAS